MTAAEIRAALAKKLPAGEYALMFEVRNAAGFGANRSADAMALSLWPSRGINLYGFEIKVSRGDWLREMRTPEKAEPIARYCDRFIVVAPEGIVQAVEVPAGWGLWELMKSGRWQHTVAPPSLTPIALDRSFLAALLRRANEAIEVRVSDGIVLATRDAAAKHKADVEREVEHRTYKHKELTEAVRKFEEASGITISGYSWRAGDIGAAVKLVLEKGEDGVLEGARRLRDRLDALLESEKA